MILQTVLSLLFANTGLAQQVEPERNWKLGLSYSVNANLNQQRSSKTYFHSFGFEFNQEVNENINVTAGIRISAQSEGTNFSLSGENPCWEDVSLSGNYKMPLSNDKTLLFFLEEFLPTSIYSRRESIRSITRTGVTFSSPILSPSLRWLHGLSGTYWLNSYRESFETLKSNPNFELRHLLGLNFSLSEWIKIGIKQNSQATRFLNNETVWRTATTEYIQTIYKHFSITLSYSLGSYDQSNGYKFIHFDDINQIVGLEVVYEI